MALGKKTEIVKKLAEMLSRSTIVIATDFRGLTVAEVSKLRRRLREAGVEYHVVKNTLARFAAEEAGKESLSSVIAGPTAFVVGYREITEPAKALVGYLRSERTTLSVKGGMLDGKLLSPAEVSRLASLPSKEVLVSKLSGVMQSPVYGLLYVLSANLMGLMGVLQARKQQLEQMPEAG